MASPTLPPNYSATTPEFVLAILESGFSQKLKEAGFSDGVITLLTTPSELEFQSFWNSQFVKLKDIFKGLVSVLSAIRRRNDGLDEAENEFLHFWVRVFTKPKFWVIEEIVDDGVRQVVQDNDCRDPSFVRPDGVFREEEPTFSQPSLDPEDLERWKLQFEEVERTHPDWITFRSPSPSVFGPVARQ